MSNTPPSDKKMPSGPASPLGLKRSSFPDGESPNCTEAFDGSKEVFPLDTQSSSNKLKGEAGLD